MRLHATLRKTTWHVPLLTLALVLVSVPMGAQAMFETEEFQINVDETGPQSHPTAAFHRSGNFVTVWESTLRGVVARFFHRNRTPVGGDTELVTNDAIGPLPFKGPLTVHKQPVVTTGQGQRFFLFWYEEEQDVSIDIFFESRFATDRTVYGRVFDLDGRPLGEPFRVGEVDGGLETQPQVTSDGNGDVTVVWRRVLDGEIGLFGRRFSGDGQPLTPEFPINDGLVGGEDGNRPAVASLGNGTSLVVWEACCDDGGEDGELGIFGRFFGADGTPLSDAFQINGTTAGNQRVPVVVGDQGRFVVAWQSPNGEFEGSLPIFRVYGRRVNFVEPPAVGPRDYLSGEERIVSSGLGRAHSSPALSVGIEGDVILTWMAWEENFRVGVFGTRLTLNGNQIEPKTEAFRISQNTIGGQFRLGLTATPLGRFLSVWEGFNDEGKLGIAARLVLPASEVCDGGSEGLSSRSAGSVPCTP